MKTDTPRTNEWETYCDECYYHLWRVRRKNERGFNDGYHVHNGEEAKALVDLLNKQDSELTAARAEIERLDVSGIHSCHDNCQRWACVLRRELIAVTEQRDGLRSGIDYASDQLHKVTEQLDQFENKLRIELRGHPDSKLWGDAGLIAATMRSVDAIDEVIDQRDRLAEALKRIAGEDYRGNRPQSAYIAEEALQSIL
jgi:hypothetical protein